MQSDAAEWDVAIEELRGRGASSTALEPACTAVVSALQRLRSDPRAGGVSLQVSHASLIMSVRGRELRVGLCWDGENYGVFLVEPDFAFSERTTAFEDEVADTVVRYLDRVRA
jgi:hypothetical protein